MIDTFSIEIHSTKQVPEGDEAAVGAPVALLALTEADIAAVAAAGAPGMVAVA